MRCDVYGRTDGDYYLCTVMHVACLTVILHEAFIDRAVHKGTRVCASTATGLLLPGCQVQQMLHGCVLHGCVLHGCVLHGCMMHGCMMYGCMMHGCIMHGCMMHGCVLQIWHHIDYEGDHPTSDVRFILAPTRPARICP